MKNKKALVIVYSVVLILFVLLAVLYVRSERKNDNFNKAIREATSEIDASEFRDSFIEGCNEAGGSTELCECTYDYVAERNTGSDIVLMALDIVEDEDNVPEVFYDAVDYCLEN